MAAALRLARDGDVLAAPIDPELADTAAFCERYGVELRGLGQLRGDRRPARRRRCATPRAWCWRRRGPTSTAWCAAGSDVRKASFAPMDDAVTLTGMEYGGITPIGLPAAWPVLIDRAVLDRDVVVIGSGLRRSKIALPPALLAELPAPR